MQNVHRHMRLMVVIVFVSLVAVACGSSSKSSSPPTSAASATTSGGASGNTASAPGVTAGTIKIGLVASLTGNAASAETGSQTGVLARFNAQNAAGGVDGRKIQLVTVDDQSSPSGDTSAVQDLISQNVFGVIVSTPYFFGGYKVLQEDGIPVTGSNADGPEWGEQPNTNMFTFAGGVDPNFPANTQEGNFFKMVGATNVAGLAYGISPSSQASIKDLKESLQAVGLKMGYQNLSIPFGGVDFTAYVLAMKQAGVDAAACSCVQSSNVALITSAQQGGLDLKADLSFSGADSTVFATPTSTQASQGAYFNTTLPPFDINNAAAETFQTNLKAVDPSYVEGTYPTYGLSTAYLGADLMIKGLEVAGQNPTRQSFISNLTQVTNYDASGLLPVPVAFNHFGTSNAQLCGWLVQVKGSNFVTINNGKPICGTYIPNSDVVKK
jgi:branched-chain amino acid transport system substrate-binding protein